VHPDIGEYPISGVYTDVVAKHDQGDLTTHAALSFKVPMVSLGTHGKTSNRSEEVPSIDIYIYISIYIYIYMGSLPMYGRCSRVGEVSPGLGRLPSYRKSMLGE
jgi:hypothetical protein